ncbi:hypothetical protein AAG906_016882 [Vitis piasezkii]
MEDEKFFACWERFREIVAACPHHGFDNWMLVSYFYEEVGMNQSSRNHLERTMNEQELMGVYLTEGLDFQAKLATSTEHGVQSCPTLPAVQDMFTEQVNTLGTYKQYSSNSPYSNTYNPVPAYAKFLKDLCTVKRRIKLSKKAFLTKQVGAIIENKAMVKYKDPVVLPSHQIGDSFMERALLDLEASVNLLPYTIYKQLGLGELKATTITLSLAIVRLKYLEE